MMMLLMLCSSGGLIFSDIIKGTVSLVFHIVGREQDIEYSGSIGSSEELMEVTLVGKEHADIGCVEVFNGVLEGSTGTFGKSWWQPTAPAPRLSHGLE
jgi:hypothetical protein